MNVETPESLAVRAARLGFILPSTNFVLEPDVYSVVPAPISAHFARLLVRSRDIGDGYESVWRECNRHLGRAVEELVGAGVAAIAYAVTAGSFYGGSVWDLRWRKGVEARWGVPATSTSYGIVQALQSFGARRITCITAYSDLLNQRLQSFLEDYEFEVLSCEGLGNTRIQQPALEESGRILELLNRSFDRRSDAVVISCSSLQAVGLIDEIERQLGLPVISSNQAVLWACAKAANLPISIDGRGALLRGDRAAT